jgi:hypothetical protein
MSFGELTNIVRTLTGITSASQILILAIGLWVLYVLLKKEIGLSYAQSLAKYTIEQQHCYDKLLAEYKIEHQKYVDILLINEKVRASVMSDSITDNNKERMQIYERVHSLYLKIQGSSGNIKGEKDDSIRKVMVDELDKEVKEVKRNLIVKLPRLGNELMDYLCDTVDGLTEDLRTIYGRGRNEYESDQSTKSLWKAIHWINENMKPYLTLNHIDLPETIIKKLNEEKDGYDKNNN